MGVRGDGPDRHQHNGICIGQGVMEFGTELDDKNDKDYQSDHIPVVPLQRGSF